MLLKLKSLAESSLGHTVHIGRGTPTADVAGFMNLVRPRAVATPLVRIGGDHDGGYLLPDDLKGISACISPGVSDQVRFDEAIASRGIDVVMADASVDGPPVEHPRFHFVQRFLDTFEDERHVRFDGLTDKAPPGDKILQMDIEGAEYRVLLDANADLLRDFRIIVVEFHHLTQIFNRFAFPLVRATFQKMLRSHHVVHIHPNNVSPAIVKNGLSVPDVMEFTFWRHDRVDLVEEGSLSFPHPLDTDNHPDLPPLVLPSCWR